MEELDNLLSVRDKLARVGIASALEDLIALLHKWEMVSSTEDENVPVRIHVQTLICMAV